MAQRINGMNVLGVDEASSNKNTVYAHTTTSNPSFNTNMFSSFSQPEQQVHSPTSPSPTRLSCTSPPHLIKMQSLVNTPGPNTPRDTPCITPSVYSPTRDTTHLSEAEGARITRQMEDLKITNMTLAAINADLEAQVRKQQQELKALRERKPSEPELAVDRIDVSAGLSSTTLNLLEAMGVNGIGRPTQLDKCLELSTSLLQEYSEAVSSVGAVEVGVRVKQSD